MHRPRLLGKPRFSKRLRKLALLENIVTQPTGACNSSMLWSAGPPCSFNGATVGAVPISPLMTAVSETSQFLVALSDPERSFVTVAPENAVVLSGSQPVVQASVARLKNARVAFFNTRSFPAAETDGRKE